MITFEVAYTPALVANDAVPRVHVLIDVLRATTAIVSMLAAGARSVVLAGSDAAADVARAATPGAMLCAERADGSIAPGADVSPSLRALRDAAVGGRDVILRSTNGTVAASAIAGRSGIGLIGALINATALMRSAIALAGDGDGVICLVCSGREAATVFCLDDAYCAGFMVNEGLRLLSVEGRSGRLRDSAKVALCLFDRYDAAVDALRDSESADVLRRIGCESDIALAAAAGSADVVPVFKAAGTAGLVTVGVPTGSPAEIRSFSGRLV